MFVNELKSEERMSRLINGLKIDRVPVIPHMEAFAGKVCNMGTKEYYLNPKSAYYAQSWCEEMFGYDGGVGYGIPYGFTQEFGGSIEYLENPKLSFPKILRKPINSCEDVEKLKIPDIKTSYVGSRIIEFNKLAYENGKNISITAGSPMNIAHCIAGTELLMRWIIKEPDLVHKIMRICTDYILENAKEHVNLFGAKNIGAGMSCPIECNDIMSPKNFEKFSLPYIKEIYDKFDEMGIRIGGIHLCGNHRKNLNYFKNDLNLKPRTLITVGTEFNMRDLAKELGEDYIIGGNLKNSLLQTGRPEEVYKEAVKMINEMKYNKGGYILTPDCTLSYLTPSANLYAMIKASKNCKY